MIDQLEDRRNKETEDHKQCCENVEQPYVGELHLGVQFKWGCHK